MRLIKFFGLIFCFSFMLSCSTFRHVSHRSSDRYKKENTTKKRVRSGTKTENAVVKKETESVLKKAHSFMGSPYKYGGTTRSGLDCSGLVFSSYDAAGIQLPRKSSDQAMRGKQIKLNDVRKGDLVFFITSGSSINHVGIVDKVIKGEVFFIHSSTSKGVIISSLEETYWNRRFVKATRIL